MKCNIIFKVDSLKTPISIEVESSDSYLTLEEIIKALKENKELYEALYNEISNNYNEDQIYQVDIDTLLNGKGLVGNTTVRELALKNPGKFPEGVTAKVLLVNNLKISGKTIYGRCINSNGEELFVINGSNNDIYHLSKFLKVRKIIMDNPNLYGEESVRYKDLETLRQKYKKESIAHLLLDFIEDGTSFKNEYFNPELPITSASNLIGSSNESVLPVSVYGYLNLVTREIEKYNQLILYNDQAINSLNQISTHVDSGIKLINLENFYNLLNTYYSDLLKQLNITDYKSFSKEMYVTDFNKDLFETTVEGKPLIYSLFKHVISKDPKFKYKIRTLTKSKMYIEFSDNTLSEEFNVGYDAIKTFDVMDVDYKGYRIYAHNYKGLKVYLYSRTFLTEETRIKEYFSKIEEAKEAISKNVLKEKLRTNSFLRFKYRNKIDDKYDTSKYIYKIENSPLTFEVGSMIYSLNIPMDINTKFYISEEERLTLSSTATLLDVHNLINSWNISLKCKEGIIELIDNAEKAMLYLYKINEILKNNRTDEVTLTTIALTINNADKVYYYINSRLKNNYSLIPTKPDELLNYVEDKSYPVVSLLNAMKEVLEEKTGISINLLTASQIAKQFPVEDFVSIDPNTSKAFIFEGQIYINTTIASAEDLLHEYAHIMLAVLKNKSPKLYEELIYKVVSLCSETELKNIRKIYSDRFELDQYEELFVKKFSEYIFPQRSTDIYELNDIFKQYDDFMKEGVKSIFDLVGEESIPSIFSKSLNTIFRKFSTDITKKLNQKNALDFDLITSSRKKTNWINKEIQKQNIIENCL